MRSDRGSPPSRCRRARARRRRVRQQQRQQHRARPAARARRRRRHRQRRRLDVRRARSTSSGARAQGPGPDGQLPGRRLRRRHRRSSPPGTVDFARQRPAAEARGRVAAAKKGDAGPDPDRSSARSPSPTTSAASKKGLKLDGATIADIFLGKIKKWNDPAIAKLEPGRQPARARRSRSSTAPTSRARRRASPSFLADYSPEWKSKVGADKTVKWPTGTGAKGNDGVAAAVKQTDGAIGYVEQAYALQNNFTYRRGEEQVRQVRRADARRRRRRPARASRSRRTCGFSDRSTRPSAGGLPDRLADVHRSSTRTCARPGMQGDDGQGASRRSSTTASATGRTIARASCRTRRCPPRCKHEGEGGRSTALQCNGSADRRASAWKPGAHHHVAAGGRSDPGAVAARAAARPGAAVGR